MHELGLNISNYTCSPICFNRQYYHIPAVSNCVWLNIISIHVQCSVPQVLPLDCWKGITLRFFACDNSSLVTMVHTWTFPVMLATSPGWGGGGVLFVLGSWDYIYYLYKWYFMCELINWNMYTIIDLSWYIGSKHGQQINRWISDSLINHHTAHLSQIFIFICNI